MDNKDTPIGPDRNLPAERGARLRAPESTVGQTPFTTPCGESEADVVKSADTDINVIARGADIGIDDSVTADETVNQSKPHAFVVMPFGEKTGGDGTRIDFNAVYAELIKPALEKAGFEPFRADEETVSGDILTDMFQELLLADLVVADMTIDNANVFYELGVRHAFRKRGIVHIQAGRTQMPFDVFNVRTIPYHIDTNGKPDPDCLKSDLEILTRVTVATWASDHDTVHSPIFNLLTGLVEQDRKTLRTPQATGFWREHKEWKECVSIARRQKRTGDILLLAEEISNPLIKEEALGEAGHALREMGQHELALKSYREGLAVNPGNVEFRREEAWMLSRLGYDDEAIVKLEGLLENEPGDTHATGYLGRIYAEIWKSCWDRLPQGPGDRREAAFGAYQWLVRAIDTYLNGFRSDLNFYDSGVSALGLATILVDLADQYDEDADPDDDIQRIRALLTDLRSTVGFVLSARSRHEPGNYWVLASLAEWRLTSGDTPSAVKRAFRKALSSARKNLFFLRKTMVRLAVFRDLDIRSEAANAAIPILKDEVERLIKTDDELHERMAAPGETVVRAFVFAGHMLDQPGREEERFPPECEDEVRRQIDAALDREEADGNDYGFLSGAACGGDIIFIEACLDREMTVHIHMPLSQAEYIERYVLVGGNNWAERFYKIRSNERVFFRYQTEQIGCREGDPYARNVRWTLYSSLLLGVERLRLIALWDGRSGAAQDEDGQRVSSMVAQMRRLGGIVVHIDISKFVWFDINRTVPQLDPEATLSLEDRTELLRKVSLFESLTNEHDVHQIAAVAKERSFSDGEYLARVGEEGKELFIIARGEVSVRSKGSDGVEYEVSRRHAGDYVGELALIFDEQRIASAVALGDVLTLTLDQDKFQKILRLRPETSKSIMRVLATRLAEATNSPRRLEG